MFCTNGHKRFWSGKPHHYQKPFAPFIGVFMFALVMMFLVKASWFLLPIGFFLFSGFWLKRSMSGHGHGETHDETIEGYLKKRKNDSYYGDDSEKPKRKNDDDIFYV